MPIVRVHQEDICTTSPARYDDMYLPKLRMAMRIGDEYRVERVGGRHWRRFAEMNRLDPDETIERVDALAARVPDCFRRAVREAEVVALESGLPGRLAERVAARADQCRKVLAG